MTRWFRMYEELLDDPKVQKLEPELFKAWVNLLCLASRHEGKLPDLAEIAFALRMTPHGASTVLSRLLDATLLDRRQGGANGAHYAPHGWKKRQFKSDTSSERVKRFRQRSRNGAETPPETETETEYKYTSNQPTSPSRAPAREAGPVDAPPALDAPAGPGLDGRGAEWIGAVADAAGLGLTPAKRRAALATLAGWLDGWPNADLEADLLAPIRAHLAKHDGPTHSLARFDAVIRDRKARAKPKPAATAKPGLPRTGEGPNETAVRAGLRRELGDGIADAWIEPARLAMNCTSLTVTCPSAFEAEYVTNQLKPALRLVARQIGGPGITDIRITAAEARSAA